jgi:hypothetical protein
MPEGCQFEQTRHGLRGVGCLSVKWQDWRKAVVWQRMTLSGGRSGWNRILNPRQLHTELTQEGVT